MLEFEREIRKIVGYQNLKLPVRERKSQACITKIVERTVADYHNGSFDFASYDSIVLNRDGKKRTVNRYESFSTEEILCIYLKRVLDRTLHIKYPNRNKFMREIFDATNILRDMADYTIFRFDFKDFFNSVSSEYVFEKCIKGRIIEREQDELMQRFVKETKYAYTGLNTSNILCEIIAKEFDEVILKKFYQNGVILYKRYIDDGIIIFNQYISREECLEKIEEAIQEIFYDKGLSKYICKTEFNDLKTQYICKHDINANDEKAFDFLGYKFVLKCINKKPTFLYGITPKKIEKYTKRINNIVKQYMDEDNMELLRHQIKAFCCRTVYTVNRYNNIIWKSKGFISNYCELRYRMKCLTEETEYFLQNVVYNAFIDNGIEPVYFMKDKQPGSPYNLYNNMKRYRTLLFVERIGISLESLKKMCEDIGINVIDVNSYDSLVREYLIKTKVGH